MTKGMEAQKYCVGAILVTLITNLNSRIDASSQIILKKNTKHNKGKDEKEKIHTTKSVQIF